MEVASYFRLRSSTGPHVSRSGLQGFDVLHLELFTPPWILAQVAIGIDIAQAFCGASISMKRAFFWYLECPDYVCCFKCLYFNRHTHGGRYTLFR